MNGSRIGDCMCAKDWHPWCMVCFWLALVAPFHHSFFWLARCVECCAFTACGITCSRVDSEWMQCLLHRTVKGTVEKYLYLLLIFQGFFSIAGPSHFCDSPCGDSILVARSRPDTILSHLLLFSLPATWHSHPTSGMILSHKPVQKFQVVLHLSQECPQSL